jgi:hypothetical protein
MDTQALCTLLDTALAISHDYFRSFDMPHWLGLTAFSGEELAELNRQWLAYQGNKKFGPWLEDYDGEVYQRYEQQLSTLWKQLEEYPVFARNPSISSLEHVHIQLSG